MEINKNMQKRIIVLQASEEEALACTENLSENFEVALYTSDVEEALFAVKRIKPDFLITALMLKKSDGISVIERAKEFSPNTKCVVLSVVSHGELMQNAINAGACYYMIKPIDYKTLCQRLNSLSGKTITTSTEKKEIKQNARSLDEKISRIFIGMGIPPHIKGYGYLREGVKLAVSTPEIINSVTKKLYPSIGKKFDTSASKVERAIRHAIEVAWNRGKVENFNALFGVRIYTEHEKPTNSEFIALVADRLLLDEMA